MKRKPLFNLREFLHVLQLEGELAIIDAEVDPTLELAEIHRRVVEAHGPALLFRNVKASPFPVATNLFGSEKRIELAFPDRPERIIQELIHLATREMPPKLQTLWSKRDALKRLLKMGTKTGSYAPVLEAETDTLDLLPILKCWPDDGGHFITLPLVYTESTENGTPNLGMYRIQRFDKKTTGLHFQIGKGGGFHYHQAEAHGKNLPVTIFLGGPPALIFSAIAPLPENVSELLFASFLQGAKIKTTPHMPHPLIAEAEFAIIGHAKPHERRLEGPFGDHYGYYGLAHDYPVFHLDKIYHRKDAIYPATVVGRPIQEDLFIGNYLQKLLSPLIPTVMPHVKELWSYSETGFHSLASAIVKERYEKEALMSAFRIFGEGQLSLTKFLILTDQQVNLSNIKEVLECALERFRPESDFYIFSHTSNDTLDYTGPKVNKGSKATLLGIGNKKRDLPAHFSGTPPHGVTKVIPFCKGCLLIQGPAYDGSDISHLVKSECFSKWPLVILVDDAAQSASSQLEFLWTVFTRFDPASDIYTDAATVKQHHISYKPPFLIDARMKPSYPKEAIVDVETKERVLRRWSDYRIPVTL